MGCCTQSEDQAIEYHQKAGNFYKYEMYKRSLGHNDVPEDVRNARFRSVEGKA